MAGASSSSTGRATAREAHSEKRLATDRVGPARRVPPAACDVLGVVGGGAHDLSVGRVLTRKLARDLRPVLERGLLACPLRATVVDPSQSLAVA